MADLVITCPKCGRRNRIAAADSHGTLRCRRCGRTLPMGASGDRRGGVVAWGVLAAALLIVIGLALGLGSGGSGPEADEALMATAQGLTPVAISTGVVQSPTEPGLAPLTVTAPEGRDYFLKLIRPGGETVMSVYVAGGQQVRTMVPLGTYYIRYASGSTWYGESALFGPGTRTYAADGGFAFYQTDTATIGHTLDLVPETEGNTAANRIAPRLF